MSEKMVLFFKVVFKPLSFTDFSSVGTCRNWMNFQLFRRCGTGSRGGSCSFSTQQSRREKFWGAEKGSQLVLLLLQMIFLVYSGEYWHLLMLQSLHGDPKFAYLFCKQLASYLARISMNALDSIEV